MKISEAIDLINNLIDKSSQKSELKIYKQFISILSGLKSRDLTEIQINSIELKLDALQLSSTTRGNKKNTIKKKLTEFTTYLEKEFSLVTAGHYTNINMVYGMIFGSGIGLSIGTVFGAGIGTAIGLSIGTSIGMALGIMYGTAKDAEAKKQNLVLT